MLTPRNAKPLIAQLARASTHGELVHGAVVSLGHFRAINDAPSYVKWAEDAKAVYFSMDTATYSLLGREELWAVNQQFLDDAIAASASFHLQTPNPIKGSFFE